MNPKNNRQILLDEMFGPDQNRSATLHIVRRAARRRRWTRYARNTACCLAGLLALGIAFHQMQPVKRALPPVMASPAHFVSTRTMPGLIVETRPNAASYVTPRKLAHFVVVTTTNSAAVDPIDDIHLLELAPGAVLVHYSGGAAVLIPTASSQFANPE